MNESSISIWAYELSFILVYFYYIYEIVYGKSTEDKIIFGHHIGSLGEPSCNTENETS